MQGVITTPVADAVSVLSQLVSSKLGLARDVALCGRNSDYWKVKNFLSVMGLSDQPAGKLLLERYSDMAIAETMSHSLLVDRASSTVGKDVLKVSVITDDAASLRVPGMENQDEGTTGDHCAARSADVPEGTHHDVC